MTTYHYSNTSVQTVLSAPASAGDGTVVIGDATGLPASYPYSVILDYGSSSVEVVTVTAASGTTLTVTRGQDGTSAQSHALNAVVVHGVVARDLQAAQDHIAASTSVHGVGSSAVVGTDTVQTLTNKTISGASNTLSNIGDSSITGLAASKLTGNFNGGSNFVSTVDATVPLTSTGTATATGNLFEAFKGAVKQFFITAAGAISAAAGITAGTTLTAGTSISAGTSITATTTVTGTTGVTAGTTVTGQGTGDVVAILADVPNANTSDLAQFKRNSTVKAKVDKDGNVTAAAGTFSGAVATGALTVTGAASTTTTATVGTNLTVNGTSTLTGNVAAGADVNVVGNVNSNGETWHSLTLQNSWTNQGAPRATAQYRKVASPPNSVEIVGAINNGTTTDGTTIATLPSGYRPSHTVTNPVYSTITTSGGESPAFNTDSSGNITCFGCGSTVNFHFFVPLDA